jgi:transcriptional regulator with GAF, ATPase, and Fis domain
VAEDPSVLVRIARLNESKKDWEAALDCLERATEEAPDALRAEIATAASRIESASILPSVKARAHALARRAQKTTARTKPRTARLTGSGLRNPVKAAPRPEVSAAEVAAAREVLASPDVVQALRDALARAKPDEKIALPLETILSRLLSCDLDLARTIDLALDLVLEATGAQRGFMLVKDEKGRLEIARHRGLARGDLPPALSTSILAEAERTGEPVFAVDAQSDPRFENRQSIQELGLRSVACVPVVEGELLGVIYLDDTRAEGRFNEKARELLSGLARAIALPLRNARRFEAQRRALAASRTPAPRRAQIVGTSKPIRELLDLIAKVAPEDVAVLVEGESGTGKELVARVIHDLSGRKGAFVAENLGALPGTLAEAELFGVTKGAFTGADRDRDGLFVRARGGTVFLDEIGELPLEQQAKLLRVLQEKEVRPLGSDRAVKIDARVVAATNRDLAGMVREGKFREDLLYRLRVVAVRVPPLRERPEDVPLLVEHFLDRIAQERGEPMVPLSAAALAKLARHEWRGNVRELENLLWRVALGGEAAIDAPGKETTEADSPLGLTVTLPGEPVALEEARTSFDRTYLNLVLARSGGNVARAARSLGVTRPALSRILKRLGIER